MKRIALSLIFWILFLISNVSSFRCDRRPYGSTMRASPSDGRFKLIVEDAEESYMPDQLYTVKITETDGESKFTAFMLSAEGDMKPDPNNPRRQLYLPTGEIRLQDADTTRFSERCPYSVEQAMNSLKSSIEVYWQAPPPGSGCVTLRAMVAESEEVWYEDGTPLTRKICEDMSQPDDVTLQLNENCQVCEEAKYEVTFTGRWSRNTHPRYYPENDWVPHYSDLVGASHSGDFVLWAPGTLASEGLKDLAEYANSSKLESEILEKIGDGVRTMIKGKGHGYHKMDNPTYSFFRADKNNHLVTTAVALYPSPDWFLGVTRFELCQNDNTWLQERELTLYPWDAGTDSGVSYESANVVTFPADAIARVQMSSYDKNSPFYETDMKDLHPFGTLHLKLIRTYERDCEQSTEGSESVEGDKKPDETNPDEPEEPSRYHNPDLTSSDRGRDIPLVPDPDAPKDCPLTQWVDWSVCEGECIDGKVSGFKFRERYHLVDGVAIEKYDPNAKEISDKEVPVYCKENYKDFEQMECEEDCSPSGTDPNMERRVMTPVSPGKPWSAKKRNIDAL